MLARLLAAARHVGNLAMSGLTVVTLVGIAALLVWTIIEVILLPLSP